MYIQSILNPARSYCHQAYNNKHRSSNFQAPRPCDRCRKHRIKCDRSLLGCSHCTKNSVLCEYKYIPKKRGPKSKLERDCNYLSSFNKRYNTSLQAYMLSPDPNTIDSAGNNRQFSDSLYTPIQQLSTTGQFGFESINLSLSIPPPIPPILINQYFPQIHSPQSLNDTSLNLADYVQNSNRVAYSLDSQTFSATLSSNLQDSYAQIPTTKFKPSSLAPSPELNQYVFDTPTLVQESFQTPSTILMDAYITPTDTLSPNYWLPIPSSCFTSASSYSTKYFQPSPELSPITF
ncbi:hypothetical protein CONCODRAFT_10563 [Conidiobolus coronatus NRRL 28638]|uniref:Zn(2)-C6 fungal-type domain-containing protein n=1 Tax=Conidiobolus coronatus (strain ATCC 28846 / CBS 209.66 / NRRL 28638) TaxID=796925 RepID=A0A137NX31_CONC2|nr:hypothetical protein CONCODRAFT_10563 [Conidiobolus coronatus NRRL 28638]|eukprot:KXN67383.1 hypothetical protein CONCODRAFT_10563 [Conidiobolus coronatus NRRL 28638]